MRIAVFGTGGVGGVYGARLAQAGHDVHFIARGRHLAAIREHGLKVLSPLGDIHLNPANTTDDPATVGAVDIVLFCVKAYDAESAAEQCRPLIGPDTGVLTLLNGVDSVGVLSRVLGAAHVIGGVANISAGIESPGVIRHHNKLQILRFGELDDRPSPRVEALKAAAVAAGIETHISANIDREVWNKFIFLAAMSAANCVTRQAVGVIREDPAMLALFERLTREVIAVARAKGVSLPDDQYERSMKTVASLPAPMKASMLAALERGERLEADHLCGAVVRMGTELGVDTPAHEAAYAACRPFLNGAAT
jgi:2-dehydropantoate 2-reductase